MRSTSVALPLLALLLPGCILANYETVDDACNDHVPGQRFLEEGIQDMLPRINCHRRFVGLTEVKVTRAIQDAVRSHANYLDQNQALEPSSPKYVQTIDDYFTERPEWPFFTGADSYDRLYASHAIDETASYTVWQVFITDVASLNPDRQFDFWGFRDVAFQPLIIGGGYAEITSSTGVSGYMNLIFSLPASSRIDVPVVFPKDGQTGVPISYASPYAAAGVQGDPLAVRSVTGYPITVTVGSSETQGGANPYGLRVIDASLTGPDGEEVDLVMALPGAYPWGANMSTAAFASIYPLLPGQTYTFEAELAWNVKPHKIVRTTFTTADTTSGGGPADTDP